MIRGMFRLTVTSAAAGLLLAVLPSTAVAVEPTGQEFGRHVSLCTTEHGFDGAHNPGTHSGYAGWHQHHMHDC